MTAKQTRDYRKTMGLCLQCGATPEPGAKTCAACNQKQNKKYFDRKEDHKCHRCGCQPAEGRKMCRSCLDARKEWRKNQIAIQGPKESEWGKATRDRERSKMISAYGGRCRCCGLSVADYLQLDHVNGGGNKDRQDRKASGHRFWAQLRREGYPEGFQLLCANCHHMKSTGRLCPVPHPWTLDK